MARKSDSGNIDKMIAINCEYFENVEDEIFPWKNTTEPNADDAVAVVDETIKINPPSRIQQKTTVPTVASSKNRPTWWNLWEKTSQNQPSMKMRGKDSS